MSGADADALLDWVLYPSGAEQQPSAPGGFVDSVADAQAWTPFSVRFRGKTLLRLATLLVLAVQIALTIVLAINDAYHMDMFTLWSFTILTAFSAVLLVALYVEWVPLTYAVLFGLPLVIGNVVFVAVAIIVIIANDATVYAEGSPCEQPPPADPDITVEQLHTGDWLEHGWPVFGVFLILLAGGEYLSRFIVVRTLRSFNAVSQWLYWFYWMFASLVLLIIYQAIFDVDEMYPTSFTTVERTFILFAIILIWQTITWTIFIAEYSVEDVNFYWLPTWAEVARGCAVGSGQPVAGVAEYTMPTLEQWLARAEQEWRTQQCSARISDQLVL